MLGKKVQEVWGMGYKRYGVWGMGYEIWGMGSAVSFLLVKGTKEKNQSYFLFLVLFSKGPLKAKALFLLKICIQNKETNHFVFYQKRYFCFLVSLLSFLKTLESLKDF